MLVYLDSVICIYAVEGAPSFQTRARARLLTLRTAGDQPTISDLTWLEARVKPIRRGDATALADMEPFLTAGRQRMWSECPCLWWTTRGPVGSGRSRISNWPMPAPRGRGGEWLRPVPDQRPQAEYFP